MNSKLTAAIAVIAFVCISCATVNKSASSTVSLDEALSNATEELKENVSGKTEIVAIIKAPDNKTADFLTDELTVYLVRSGIFTVLERGDALQAVNAEQQFQMSGLVSDESAVGIGHYLGAKVVVSGTFDPYAGFSQLRLRAVDVKSSQILAMPSARINSDDRVLANIMPKKTRAQRVNEQALDHLNRGKDLIREGKTGEATNEFERAIALDKKLAEAYFYLGNAYVNRQDYGNAIANYTRAIQIDRNYAAAYANRGIAWYLKGEVSGYFIAIQEFTQAIRLDLNNANTYYNRGAAYVAIKNYDDAIGDFTEAIRLNPDNAPSYNYRGVAYAYKNDHDRAIANYNRAIQINPNYAIAYYNRADSHRIKGDIDQAIADLDVLFMLDPDHPVFQK